MLNNFGNYLYIYALLIICLTFLMRKLINFSFFKILFEYILIMHVNKDVENTKAGKD